jgi:hypothetical protein
MRFAYEEDVMLEDTITAWHAAVNNRDLAAARAAVTDPVNVSGPRGTGRIAAAAFVDWIVNSGIRLRPLSWHPVDGDTMVVEQEASWPDSPDATTVATLFKVREGAVSLAHRFDSLDEALRAGGREQPDAAVE